MTTAAVNSPDDGRPEGVNSTGTPACRADNVSGPPLLSVEDLAVDFTLDEGVVQAVQGISLTVAPRQIVGVIGESGCGKSVTAQAIMRILPKTASIRRGRVLLQSKEPDGPVLDLAAIDGSGRTARSIRGGEIAMIFQEPMTAFSPVHTIGNQIMETIRLHRKLTRRAARAAAAQMLDQVGVPDGGARLDSYPFQLSGGLRQRAMIAMALSTKPRLVIADEPTTALDVTIQAQILELMLRLRRDLGTAFLLITHDLGVVAETCDFVHVMYLGRIVESGTVDQIFHNPLHPYTQALLESMPRLNRPGGGALRVIQGAVPGPFTTIGGCPFHPRCDQRIEGTCNTGAAPDPMAMESDHTVSCWLHGERGT